MKHVNLKKLYLYVSKKILLMTHNATLFFKTNCHIGWSIVTDARQSGS